MTTDPRAAASSTTFFVTASTCCSLGGSCDAASGEIISCVLERHRAGEPLGERRTSLIARSDVGRGEAGSRRNLIDYSVVEQLPAELLRRSMRRHRSRPSHTVREIVTIGTPTSSRYADIPPK